MVDGGWWMETITITITINIGIDVDVDVDGRRSRETAII
jgi:hypothetical protein